MKRNIFNAIIILICSVFAVTIAATGCVLYSDYKTGIKAAEKRFEKLFNQTEEAISKYSVPAKDFIRDFNKAIGSPEYYYSINLKNGNQEIYNYPAEEQKGSKFFTITKSSRLTEGSSLDLTLTVCIYTLSSEIIFSRIRVAFIIILAATLLSSLCLIYIYLSDSKSPQKENGKKAEFEQDEISADESEGLSDSDFSIDFTDEENFELNDDYGETNEIYEPEQDEKSEEKAYEKSEKTDTEDTGLLQDDEITMPEEIAENAEPKLSEVQDAEEISQDTKESPAADESDSPVLKNTDDLFSSGTGFCVEKYLTTRLDSELARASSGELDLSLILLRIKGLSLQEPCGTEICRQILDIFHYRDMLFEYKTDGIAVIFSNSDIDKAMESCESIYAEICATLNKYEKRLKPVFGIASRSLRFISGERLITEAEQALLHAAEDAESPIIAFRVNPEKYRQYMASKEKE
ncbi:MAG: hypothetical protein ACI4LX_11435 [Treponema sp.]